MIFRASKLLPILSLFALALTVNAHPGHGPLQHGAAHFMTSPWHVLTGLAASLVLLIMAQQFKAARARVTLRAISAGIAVSTLALWAARA